MKKTVVRMVSLSMNITKEQDTLLRQLVCDGVFASGCECIRYCLNHVLPMVLEEKGWAKMYLDSKKKNK